MRKKSLVWWQETIRGKRSGVLARTVRQAARLGALGYRAGVKGRELAYEHGLFEVKRLPRPTLCVGNITVGGTGKTPVVIRLVQDLMERGVRPAVLLRGYKRAQSSKKPVLVRDPKGIRGSVRESGDEAMELAMRLPGAYVAVGADRYAVGQFLLQQYAVDCFVLDDGFQHYRLGRDVNVVTLDVTDPWGGGNLLPAGLLRESPEALRRADLVVLTRTGLVGPDRLSVLRAEVGSFVRDPKIILESRHEPNALIRWDTGESISLAHLKGKSVLAVSGIGNPRSFESTLSQLGTRIAGSLNLADHTGHPRDVWKWVSHNRHHGEWVIMTEKDAMRWARKPGDSRALPDIFALRVNVVMTAGESIWKAMVVRVAHLVKVSSHLCP